MQTFRSNCYLTKNYQSICMCHGVVDLVLLNHNSLLAGAIARQFSMSVTVKPNQLHFLPRLLTLHYRSCMSSFYFYLWEEAFLKPHVQLDLLPHLPPNQLPQTKHSKPLFVIFNSSHVFSLTLILRLQDILPVL